MVFNDTTSRTGLIQDCEDTTGLGAAAISGNTEMLQKFTRWINQWYQKVTLMILKAQDDWDFDDANKADYPILKTNLVAGQDKYTLPTKNLKIKRVEITYDGTNWKKANSVDIGDLQFPTDSQTLAYVFSVNAPRYDVEYGSLVLYPTPPSNVDYGLKIWIMREVTEFQTSDTTLEPGFDEPFHKMLSLGASLEFAVANQMASKKDFSTILQDYEERLNTFYGTKAQDSDHIMKPYYIEYD